MRILYSFDNESFSIELALVDDLAEMIPFVCNELRTRHSHRRSFDGIEAPIADAMLNSLAGDQGEVRLGDLGSGD